MTPPCVTAPGCPALRHGLGGDGDRTGSPQGGGDAGGGAAPGGARPLPVSGAGGRLPHGTAPARGTGNGNGNGNGWWHGNGVVVARERGGAVHGVLGMGTRGCLGGDRVCRTMGRGHKGLWGRGTRESGDGVHGTLGTGHKRPWGQGAWDHGAQKNRGHTGPWGQSKGRGARGALRPAGTGTGARGTGGYGDRAWGAMGTVHMGPWGQGAGVTPRGRCRWRPRGAGAAGPGRRFAIAIAPRPGSSLGRAPSPRPISATSGG